jgi:hypothetical protein
LLYKATALGDGLRRRAGLKGGEPLPSSPQRSKYL